LHATSSSDIYPLSLHDALPISQHWIAPYARFRGFHLDLAFSWELAGQIAGNVAVAFAEEFFYRGYMTVRFEERWGPVRSALTARSEEHTSELQSLAYLVCRLLL